MADYCTCGQKANQLCRDCRKPACGRHTDHTFDLNLNGHHSRTFRAYSQGICGPCFELRIRVLTSAPEFSRFARGRNLFESACRVASWATCLSGYIENHTSGAACCPAHWMYDQTRSTAPTCTIDDNIAFSTVHHHPRGPFISTLTMATFTENFIRSTRQRGLLPPEEVQLGTFKRNRVFRVHEEVVVAPTGAIYITAPSGQKAFQIHPDSVTTDVNEYAQTQLRSRKDKTIYTSGISTIALLSGAHFALLELPLPRTPKDYG